MSQAGAAEHTTEPQAIGWLREYDALIRPGRALIAICPRKAGFKRAFSFALPRWAGRFFTYSEFVMPGRTPDHPATRPPSA